MCPLKRCHVNIEGVTGNKVLINIPTAGFDEVDEQTDHSLIPIATATYSLITAERHQLIGAPLEHHKSIETSVAISHQLSNEGSSVVSQKYMAIYNIMSLVLFLQLGVLLSVLTALLFDKDVERYFYVGLAATAFVSIPIVWTQEHYVVGMWSYVSGYVRRWISTEHEA